MLLLTGAALVMPAIVELMRGEPLPAPADQAADMAADHTGLQRAARRCALDVAARPPTARVLNMG
jgi:hypothetical protein